MKMLAKILALLFGLLIIGQTYGMDGESKEATPQASTSTLKSNIDWTRIIALFSDSHISHPYNSVPCFRMAQSISDDLAIAMAEDHSYHYGDELRVLGVIMSESELQAFMSGKTESFYTSAKQWKEKLASMSWRLKTICGFDVASLFHNISVDQEHRLGASGRKKLWVFHFTYKSGVEEYRFNLIDEEGYFFRSIFFYEGMRPILTQIERTVAYHKKVLDISARASMTRTAPVITTSSAGASASGTVPAQPSNQTAKVIATTSASASATTTAACAASSSAPCSNACTSLATQQAQ